MTDATRYVSRSEVVSAEQVEYDFDLTWGTTVNTVQWLAELHEAEVRIREDDTAVERVSITRYGPTYREACSHLAQALTEQGIELR